jgi:hypothetical protein
MASAKDSSQTLLLNIITKDKEEEVKIWECDDYPGKKRKGFLSTAFTTKVREQGCIH